MANFNKVILAGRLTRDPELRYTPSGKAIAKFGLAVSRTWTNDAGEKKEDVMFVDVSAFERKAEVVSQYFKKGRPILVEGRLKLDTWDDKQTGAKRSKHEVVLETFSFIDSKTDGGDSAPNPLPPRPASAPAPRAPRPRPHPLPTSRLRATTSPSDLRFTHHVSLPILWQRPKLSSPNTSSDSAVNPTKSKSPPATRGIFSTRKGSRFP